MLQTAFHPFPELKTDRLLLRRITMDDAAAVLFLRSDKDVMRFIDREPAKSLKDAEDFIKRINKDIDDNVVIQWAITLMDNPGKLIGTICLWQFQQEHYRAETGYVLMPDQWRKGIMKEALLKVLDYGFKTLGLHSIEAQISPGNSASAALLESTGFTREGYFKEDFYFRGNFLDTAVYSKLNI